MTENLLGTSAEMTPANGGRFRTVSGREVHVTGLLGQSAAGVVFRATIDGDEGPQDVAVKMLRLRNREGLQIPTSALEEQKALMAREASILQTLSGHPNILHLIATEQVALPDSSVHKEQLGSLPVLITEVAGPRNLREQMSDGMDRHKKVRALVDVGDALTYAHDNNIVHGDVKVTNVLARPARWLLADWGLADDMTKLKNLNAVTMIRGTLYAIAPERLSGTVGPENDVYSMGVMIHTLLTGEVPFPKIAPTDLARYEEAHRLRRFPSLRSLGIREPKLQEIIKAASEKKPEDRPSMREVTNEVFDVYLHGENRKVR